MATHRIERLEKSIERELQNILMFEAHDNLLKYVSITKVAVGKDLSYALIWYTVMGTDEEKKATTKALIQARGYLRSELARRLEIRHTPELRFKYDESLEYGSHIEEILRDINEKK